MLTIKSSVFFALIGILFMIKNPLHKHGISRAQGIITDYEKKQTENGFIYFAKVKFPVGEEEILFTDSNGSGKKPRQGKIVSVLYDKEKPEQAEIESNFIIIFPWLFILAAFFILLHNLMQIFIF